MGAPARWPRSARSSGVRELVARWAKRGRRWNTRPYYPAILDIAGRTALVVGAGKVGEGKIEGLLNADAHVKVVSLDATDHVRRWAGEGGSSSICAPTTAPTSTAPSS